jgi:hypothetical protein
MKQWKHAVIGLVALVGIASANLAAQVTATDAQKFLGAWTLGMETPQGAMTMDLTLKAADAKVTGELTSQMAPAPQTITDITKAGESLVLKYMLDFQGMPIPAKITITPSGEKYTASFDFADGQFTVDGTAAKK